MPLTISIDLSDRDLEHFTQAREKARAAGSGGPLQGSGDRPDPGRPEGVDLLPQIDHIVVYMQENHSYDSYFGTFHRGDGYRMRHGTPTDSNLDTAGNAVPVFHAAETCQPGRGVSQNWVSTHTQIHGGRMDGFLFNEGGHAIYEKGLAAEVLRDLGVTFTYGTPSGVKALLRPSSGWT